MHLPSAQLLLLFVSGVVAGVINSVAGGGSLVTFPTMLHAGLAPVAANATNTVALVPGSAAAFWGYRDTLSNTRTLVWIMAVPSVLGGALGALAVLRVSDATFQVLIPWLLLGATALFALQGSLAAMHSDEDPPRTPSSTRLIVVAIAQLFVATYGGFFGAGIGILMLAALSALGVRDVHRANGLKNLAAACINSVAGVAFLVSGKVVWTHALAVALGAIVGGRSGANVARALGPRVVRALVVAVGITLTVVMFMRARG